MNRIDPDLFAACFRAWAAELSPGSEALIAIDGKTSRRTHDRRRGQPACTWFRPGPPANA